MKFNTVLKPLFFATLLCGSLLAPALADDALTVPAGASSHHYVFTAAELDSDVYVRLTDDADEDFNPIVVEILADAGGMNRMDRAKKIAERLNSTSQNDATFANDMRIINQSGEVVIVVSTQQGQLVITADDKSKRTANAPTREIYAQRILENIQSRLKGIKLRDAAFDYQLTGDQKKQRAYEYYKQAQDAYADKDTDVAISKYKLALTLSPDYNYCRLKLANLYAELNQKNDARTEYQKVAAATDADPDDKKVALDKLQTLGANG